MKKIYIILLAAAAMVTSSCSDFLSESNPNAVTAGSYYNSEADIVSVLNSAYESLKGSYYFVNGYHFTDVHAHLTICTDSGANSGIPYQFYNYTVNEENTYVKNRYSAIYKSIARANKLIEHLDDISYSNVDTRNSYEAQARFIRALGFYHLVTEWGPVPVFDKALTSRDEINAANHRAPKADVYQRIFDDLQYVIDSPLSDLTPAADCGRVNKVAAYALYGKAALQKATDEDFASEKTALLKTAKDMLTAAWDKRSFTELTSIPFSSIWDLSTQKGCAENIFQINYIQGNATLGSNFAYIYGPMTTGVTSKHLGEGCSMTNEEVYNSYDAADVRKSFLKKTTYRGLEYYHTMKYVDLACGSDGYGGNNWVVLRYADVALMLAEAWYWDGNETEAKVWLNKVRARAGLGAWSGTDLRQGIYDERMKEFIQEGLRWHDLLRMYTGAEMIAHFSAINPNFSEKDLLFPIPYSERILNPDGLPQNPGYLAE